MFPGIKDCSCLDQGFKVISSEDLDLNWSKSSIVLKLHLFIQTKKMLCIKEKICIFLVIDLHDSLSVVVWSYGKLVSFM
jgi:hypothetical protein